MAAAPDKKAAQSQSNVVGSDLSLPVDALLDSRVEAIIAMGFDAKLAGLSKGFSLKARRPLQESSTFFVQTFAAPPHTNSILTPICVCFCYLDPQSHQA